jgi:hypothetical protein
MSNVINSAVDVLQRGQRFCRRPRLRVVNPSSCNTLRNDLDLGSSSTINGAVSFEPSGVDAVVAKVVNVMVNNTLRYKTYNSLTIRIPLLCRGGLLTHGRITPMYVTLPTDLQPSQRRRLYQNLPVIFGRLKTGSYLYYEAITLIGFIRSHQALFASHGNRNGAWIISFGFPGDIVGFPSAGDHHTDCDALVDTALRHDIKCLSSTCDAPLHRAASGRPAKLAQCRTIS